MTADQIRITTGSYIPPPPGLKWTLEGVGPTTYDEGGHSTSLGWYQFRSSPTQDGRVYYSVRSRESFWFRLGAIWPTTRDDPDKWRRSIQFHTAARAAWGQSLPPMVADDTEDHECDCDHCGYWDD